VQQLKKREVTFLLDFEEKKRKKRK